MLLIWQRRRAREDTQTMQAQSDRQDESKKRHNTRLPREQSRPLGSSVSQIASETLPCNIIPTVEQYLLLRFVVYEYHGTGRIHS